MDDLKMIKKHYGEKMMHLCRELFPTLLETPGLLYTLLEESFNPSRLLYDDIVDNQLEDEFKAIIYSKINLSLKKENVEDKSPAELLDEAGYILYECHNEDEIQAFKKYYAPDEELCTFRGGRLNRCHVFFAVKKDVDRIKRSETPKRQDEYGTSVISIQFTRGEINTVSIKNRYNHTVPNPDSTFSNNLDKIAEGLTEAFEKTYGLNTEAADKNIEIPGYIRANDGKLYKVNYEINNVYYCPDNIIIDNFEVIRLDKSKYLVMDYFIVDLANKKIVRYENLKKEKSDIDYIEEDLPRFEETFLDDLDDIKSLEIKSDKEKQEKTLIINKDIIITLDKTGKIKSYTNPHIIEVKDGFLFASEGLVEIDLPNVVKIGNKFLGSAEKAERINLPKVESIGNRFMTRSSVEEVILPNVKTIGDAFMRFNDKAKKIFMPKVESIGQAFITTAKVEEIDLPEVKEIKSGFMSSNSKVTKVNMPKVENIGSYFLQNAEKLKELYLPRLYKLGLSSLENAFELNVIDLPELTILDDKVMRCVKRIKELHVPKVEIIGNSVLSRCEEIETVELPKTTTIGEGFLESCNKLNKFIAPLLDIERVYSDTYKKIISFMDIADECYIPESFINVQK